MYSWNKSRFSIATVMLVTWYVLLWCGGSTMGVGCTPKRYKHSAMQTDFKGKRCWDYVRTTACRGHCLSYEIPDWEFPYKRSNHYVCGFNKIKSRYVKLRHCDLGVQPGTDILHIVEAVSCICKICSSEDTSCEWLPPYSTLLENYILKEELKEQLQQLKHLK